MFGFFGKILGVNAGDRKSRAEEMDEARLSAHMGGKGLGGRLLLDRQPARTDPFTPESHLVMALGPATDSPIHGAYRHGLFAKSPLSGLYSESYACGDTAAGMSRTGFDAFDITGAADRPLWLEITDQGVFFHDAGDLWGLDTVETEAALRKRVAARSPAVLTIGPAGENQVRFAAVNNGGRRGCGHTGLGAVLGSKKIKAVVFHGGRKRPFADPQGLAAYAKEMLGSFADHPVSRQCCRFGAPKVAKPSGNTGEDPARRRGPLLKDPESDTAHAFGGLCRVESVREVIFLNGLCVRLGLDTMTAGHLAAFAIAASRRGKIDFPIDYNQPDRIAALLRKVVLRQDVGGLLAEGIRPASEELGLEDIAVPVKGREPSGMLASDRIADQAALFIDFEDHGTLFDTLIVCRRCRDHYPWEELRKIFSLTTGEALTQTDLKALAGRVITTARAFNLREGMQAADEWLSERLLGEGALRDGRRAVPEGLRRLVDDYCRLRGWGKPGQAGDSHDA